MIVNLLMNIDIIIALLTHMCVPHTFSSYTAKGNKKEGEESRETEGGKRRERERREKFRRRAAS